MYFMHCDTGEVDMQRGAGGDQARKLRTSENVDGMKEESKSHQHIYTYLFSFNTIFTNVIIT
jgi:hypothetical protein